MGRRASLKNQVFRALQSQLAIGESKFADKRVILEDGRRLSDTRIYTYETLKTYMKHALYFTAWAKAEHGCKTLAQAREFANDWIQTRIDAGLSAYTVKLEVAALEKLYNTAGYGAKDAKSAAKSTNERLITIPTPERDRAGITRSRGEKESDNRFSETKNAALVEFCRCTGLRRQELTRLKGSQLIASADGYKLAVVGKGGRYREAPIIGTPEAIQRVVERIQSAGEGRVWEKVHTHADVHSYRAEYATAIYNAHARDLSTLARSEKYYCRGDMAGHVYDRDALLAASIALGHNRVSVVAEHYLR